MTSDFGTLLRRAHRVRRAARFLSSFTVIVGMVIPRYYHRPGAHTPLTLKACTGPHGRAQNPCYCPLDLSVTIGRVLGHARYARWTRLPPSTVALGKSLWLPVIVPL